MRARGCTQQCGLALEEATAFDPIWAGLVIVGSIVANIGAGMAVDLYGQDPAQAATARLALDSVRNRLGGGIELPGGSRVLLVGRAALRAGGLPRTPNCLGVVIAVLVPLVLLALMGLVIWFVARRVRRRRANWGAAYPSPRT